MTDKAYLALAREKELLVDCPTCGAPKGQPCVTKSGRKAADHHGARWSSAVDAGVLSLSPEYRS